MIEARIAWYWYAAVFVLSGCISNVTVEKFTGHEKGLRYSLPATYLIVTPKSDGSASYEWKSLPDPENEYVIRSRSFLSKHSVDVQLEQGVFLRKVVTGGNSALVAAKGLEAVQSVYSARADAEKVAAKDKIDKIEAARKDELAAEIELAQAKVELEFLQREQTPDVDRVKAATLAVKKAQAKLDLIRQAKSVVDPSVLAKHGKEDGTAFPQAWGPVIFRVVMSEKSVKLIAMEPQRKFDTSLPVDQAGKVASRFSIEGNSQVSLSDAAHRRGHALVFSIVAEPEIGEVRSAGELIEAGSLRPVTNTSLTFSVQAGGKSTVVDVDPAPPVGKYVLSFSYRRGKTGPLLKSQVNFGVGP